MKEFFVENVEVLKEEFFVVLDEVKLQFIVEEFEKKYQIEFDVLKE